MYSHEPHTATLPELTFMERAILVRVFTAMRENDPDAVPSSSQQTTLHCEVTRAAKEASAAGPGARLEQDLGAARIVYEVLDERSVRITVRRTTVAAPYPTRPFHVLLPLPGVRLQDDGAGTYVFEIRPRRSDDEELRGIADALRGGGTVTITDEEAKALGLIPERSP